MASRDPRSTYPEVRAAVSRARWAVLQTGLITSGLALFGVYVLANRISDAHVTSLYVMRWIPAGVLLVGIIAGSGYLLAAWWFGVFVGARMLAVILLFQLCTYFAAQYAEFQTLSLINRFTREPVEFVEYFRYTTVNWTPQPRDELVPEKPLGDWGYALRGGEAVIFCMGGAGAVLALTGRPRCGICRGHLHRRRIGAILAIDAGRCIGKLQELAHAGNLASFKAVLNHATAAFAGDAKNGATTLAVELTLVRCAVCGCGHLDAIAPRLGPETLGPAPMPRIELDPRFAAELSALNAAPART
ncbi:MAG: hypothetical protein ABIP55_08950 [Tepidisphaeraceae bacterium]